MCACPEQDQPQPFPVLRVHQEPIGGDVAFPYVAFLPLQRVIPVSFLQRDILRKLVEDPGKFFFKGTGEERLLFRAVKIF